MKLRYFKIASQAIHPMINKNIIVTTVETIAALYLACLTLPDKILLVIMVNLIIPVQLAIVFRTGKTAMRCSALSVVKTR